MRPTATLPQTQPACLTRRAAPAWSTAATGRCRRPGPCRPTRSPGVYLAHLVRDDTGGSAASSRSSSATTPATRTCSSRPRTTTWQAYNSYGGNSLYSCTVNCPPGNPRPTRALRRCPTTGRSTPRDDGGHSWLMYSEYPMIRFLEANGYDVCYTPGIDVDRAGRHCSTTTRRSSRSGHDEYWSGTQRANVEAARDEGVNLAFFSGNEVFWKTRGEPSIDGSQHRRTAPWSATRRPTTTLRRSSGPHAGRAPGGIPGSARPVTAAGPRTPYRSVVRRQLRHHRHPGAAPSTPSCDSGATPPWRTWPPAQTPRSARVPARSATSGTRTPTTASDLRACSTCPSTTSNSARGVHGLRHEHQGQQQRHPPPDAVPRAQRGTGLRRRDRPVGMGARRQPATATATDPRMQQATVNLFADMGVQPYSLITGLTPATASTDTVAPTSTITSPAAGANIADGTRVTVTGTAADTGGVVAGVEVSTDGGTTWHAATGTTSWSYSWVAHGNPTAAIKSRAVDDSGNVENPSAGVTVNIGVQLLDLGHRCDAGHGRLGSGARRGGRRQVQVRRRRARSPASGSTRRARTPGPTSGTCGAPREPSSRR